MKKNNAALKNKIAKTRNRVEVIFDPKSTSKTQTALFTPSPRLVGEKINELHAITFDEESASDAQTLLAPPKREFSEKTSAPIVLDFFACGNTYFCSGRPNFFCPSDGRPKFFRPSDGQRTAVRRLSDGCPTADGPSNDRRTAVRRRPSVRKLYDVVRHKVVDIITGPPLPSWSKSTSRRPGVPASGPGGLR